MGKKIKIPIKENPERRGHEEHKSGSGEHDNRPKRTRTREKEEEQWKEEYGIEDIITVL